MPIKVIQMMAAINVPIILLYNYSTYFKLFYKIKLNTFSLFTSNLFIIEMYSIVSRNKTNGSYTKCAVMNKECNNYGNKVEDMTFDELKDAINFILKIGDKNKIYYICGQYNRATDLHSHKKIMKYLMSRIFTINN